MDFSGEISASKSLMNRALIIRSYNPGFQIVGHSSSEDVTLLKSALDLLYSKNDFFAGDGGTTLRFLATRLSRVNGCFKIQMSPRLSRRPHQHLIEALSSLGIKTIHKENTLEIFSSDWKIFDKPISISQKVSSQFLSALLLNSWGLDKDFKIEILDFNNAVSNLYLEMTVQILKKAGMQIEREKNLILVPKNQRPHSMSYIVEPDMSSVFSLAAAAIFSGRCEIRNIPSSSLQPDFVFINILKEVGASITYEKSTVIVQKTHSLKSCTVNLSNSPDLFPVLCVLMAHADGVSHLHGAPHLIHKESNRIEQTQKLLKGLGVQFDALDDGIKIYGKGMGWLSPHFEFDSDHDHRMAMAAGVAKKAGHPITIKNSDCVNKSFPNFWIFADVQP